MGGIAGTRRFLDRLWTLAEEFLKAKPQTADSRELEITAAVHKTIKKVTSDLENLSFNTAIAAMMGLVNELYRLKAEKPLTNSYGWRFGLESLTQLLAPLAPHISEELWRNLGHETSVHISAWPAWDEKLVNEEVISLVVQINGKVRAEIAVAADISHAEAITAAKADQKVAALIAGKTIKKEIYVPGRLVSLVF